MKSVMITSLLALVRTVRSLRSLTLIMDMEKKYGQHWLSLPWLQRVLVGALDRQPVIVGPASLGGRGRWKGEAVEMLVNRGHRPHKAARRLGAEAAARLRAVFCELEVPRERQRAPADTGVDWRVGEADVIGERAEYGLHGAADRAVLADEPRDGESG